MTETAAWEVDRVAARTLLAALKVEVSEDALERAVSSFSAHRRTACEWAARRTHSATVNALETASVEEFADRDEHWRQGYGHAEQQLRVLDPIETLGLGPASAKSKGQILRSMVKQAKWHSR